MVESLRLYPQPPLLIRRSLKSDKLPGISVSNVKKSFQFCNHSVHGCNIPFNVRGSADLVTRFVSGPMLGDSMLIRFG